MCFLSVLIVTVVKRVRVRENAGSGRDGGWVGRERVCLHVRQREGQRERGEEEEVHVWVCVRACVRACVRECVRA